jgi:hypothetical protein
MVAPVIHKPVSEKIAMTVPQSAKRGKMEDGELRS